MRRILVIAAVAALCTVSLAGTTQSVATAQSGNTWQIDFYNNPDWAGSPVMTMFNTYISFNWGYGSPGPAVPADNFTARMTTDAYLPYGGTYSFTTTADDEVVLTIDNVTYLDTRNAGQSGKSFAMNIALSQGTHRVEVLYREYTALAYIYVTWVYVKDGTVPPPPPPPPPPSNCAPQSATSVQTKYGDYTPCIQQNQHQSACFQSDGAWDSPNLGSIEMEPKIEIWGNCKADSITSFPISCDPNIPPKQYKCSKTEAGWFPG